MGSFIRFSSSSIVSIPSISSIILHVLIRASSSQSPAVVSLRLPFHCNNRKDFARYRRLLNFSQAAQELFSHLASLASLALQAHYQFKSREFCVSYCSPGLHHQSRCRDLFFASLTPLLSSSKYSTRRREGTALLPPRH